MNRIVFGFFAVSLYFAVGGTVGSCGKSIRLPRLPRSNVGRGQALECYNCKVGFWNLCFTTKKTCEAGQQCFSGIGKAGDLVDIKMKGCLELSKCNKTEQMNFPSNSSTQIYQMTKTCCATDLCNSALGHIHASAVSMALTTLTSVFMVKFLI